MVRRVASWLASALMVGAFGCLVVACSSSGGSPVTRAPDQLHSGKSVAPSALMYALRADGHVVADIKPHEWAFGPSGSALAATVDGVDAYLLTFADAKATRDWSAMVSGIGNTASVVGDTWAINLGTGGAALVPTLASQLHAQEVIGS